MCNFSLYVTTSANSAMAMCPEHFFRWADFRKRRGQRLPPQDPPAKLPPLPVAIEAGKMPSAADLEAAIAQASADRCCCASALQDWAICVWLCGSRLQAKLRSSGT